MKIQLEEIIPRPGSSFNIMVNPRLSDFYFWHFHEAFELIFIEAETGTRHVGDHVSRYKDSDLVFIGSNIPHLNFDYGIKTPYQKIVLHIQVGFLKSALIGTPELVLIKDLFEKSKFGIAFGSDTKLKISERIKNLGQWSDFELYVEVISIFHILANAQDLELLHKNEVLNNFKNKEQLKLKKIFQFLDENFLRKIELEEVAQLSSLSKAAFCRFFKKMTKLTFVEFLNHYRINHAKSLLLTDTNVTEACYQSGFESISYFNRTFKKITQHNPSEFKRNFSNV
jgi:AraC-like DNA-binding protein